ncbi:MAG: CPBP family intramembrane glutamic endopeptidase [Chloroflexota bacterium]
MKEVIEFWLFIAFVGLLLLMRFDAQRFGVAEYDDEDRHGGWRGWLRRLSFYAFGIGLILLIYRIYPQPISVLHLDLGTDRQQALLLGLLFGLGGMFVAFAFAWWRYRRFRLPSASAYPGAIINAVGTAFIDEALFRGIILGLLLSWGWPPALAIAFETILYGLATRLGAPGRSRAMLLISLGVGVVAGWLTWTTLGIGAAVLGHAITRFSIFLATGHAGSVRPPGWEPEELASWALPPTGWDIVTEPDAGPAALPMGPRGSTGLRLPAGAAAGAGAVGTAGVPGPYAPPAYAPPPPFAPPPGYAPPPYGAPLPGTPPEGWGPAPGAPFGPPDGYGPPPGYGAPPEGFAPPPGFGPPPEGFGPPPGYGPPDGFAPPPGFGPPPEGFGPPPWYGDPSGHPGPWQGSGPEGPPPADPGTGGQPPAGGPGEGAPRA